MSWGRFSKELAYCHCVCIMVLTLLKKKGLLARENVTPVIIPSSQVLAIVVSKQNFLKLKHWFFLCLLVIDGISVSLSDNCSKARKKPLTLLMKNALNYTHRALVL